MLPVSRETHEPECRNYVKHVRTSAKGLPYCGFISAFTDMSVVCGVQFQVPLHFRISLPADETCDKGDTSFCYSMKILAVLTEFWNCTLTVKVAETVRLLAFIWDFPFRLSVEIKSRSLKLFYSVRAANYVMLRYLNIHHHRILLRNFKFIIHYDPNILHNTRDC
jgi:hypothetical protein